jgi:hypothetical protein
MDTGIKAAVAQSWPLTYCSALVKNEWIYKSMPLWLVLEQHILLILDNVLYGNEACSVTFNFLAPEFYIQFK